jgi:hypothetical protein
MKSRSKGRLFISTKSLATTLRPTLWAPTSLRFDVFIEILLAVVIRKLLTRFYILYCVDVNTALLNLGHAIRPTGVVDIPGKILPCHAIDSEPAMHYEKIFTAATVLLLFGKRSPHVLNDALPLLKQTQGKEPEP